MTQPQQQQQKYQRTRCAIYDREAMPDDRGICSISFFRRPVNSSFEHQNLRFKTFSDTNLLQSGQLAQPLQFEATGVSVTLIGNFDGNDEARLARSLIEREGFVTFSVSGRPVYQQTIKLVPSSHFMPTKGPLPKVMQSVLDLKHARALRLDNKDAEAALIEMRAYAEFPILTNNEELITSMVDEIYKGIAQAPDHFTPPIHIRSCESFDARLDFQRTLTISTDIDILAAFHGELIEPERRP